MFKLKAEIIPNRIKVGGSILLIGSLICLILLFFRIFLDLEDSGILRENGMVIIFTLIKLLIAIMCFRGNRAKEMYAAITFMFLFITQFGTRLTPNNDLAVMVFYLALLLDLIGILILNSKTSRKYYKELKQYQKMR